MLNNLSLFCFFSPSFNEYFCHGGTLRRKAVIHVCLVQRGLQLVTLLNKAVCFSVNIMATKFCLEVGENVFSLELIKQICITESSAAFSKQKNSQRESEM